ncbi:GNAT family N-acetyltransferase [bacterium]|nr:GNAT family N-acetyltransferase [bacterium]
MKIVLRDISEEDFQTLYEIQREPAVYEMAVTTPRSEDAFLQRWREKAADPEILIQVIEAEGVVVGDIESFLHEDRRVVGYLIGSKYWGRGIATAALTEFLTAHEKRRPLSAFAAVTNKASYRVLQKCGFHQVDGPSVGSDGVEEFRMDLL